MHHHMERVTGIGGLFFRARDPEALNAWYAEHLGIEGDPPGAAPWRQQAGLTVFSAFEADTDYFKRPDQQHMVNFRVRDLDAMVQQLRSAGVDVEVHSETYPNGRFAELFDPEGNPVQLWEPAGADEVSARSD